MADISRIEWIYGVRPATSGPLPKPPRDGDKKQARQRVNIEVKGGRRAHPNSLPCVDCGHVWQPGERRHEYDHHLGYAAEHHGDVESVCTLCHAKRDNARAKQTHCKNGHEFTPENTYIASNGTRHCRACSKERERKRGPRGKEFWAKINAKRRAIRV